MPEGPQIRALAARLRAALRNAVLMRVEQGADQKVSNVVREVSAGLGSAPVDFITSRGKLLLIRAGALHILIHLRLSGEFGPADACSGHVLLKFTFDVGVYTLTDPRKLAQCTFTDAAGAAAAFADLGPDVMSDTFSSTVLGSALGGTAAIGAALVNQRLVAGIGNCIRSEALWLARIAPDRPAQSLSAAEVGRLHSALRTICTEQYSCEISGTPYVTRVYKRRVDKYGAAVKKQKMGSLMIYWVPTRQTT